MAELENSGASDPGSILRKAFEEKLARNPHYSLRAFARDLGVSHALLSLVLRGKKVPSWRTSLRMAGRLSPPWAAPLRDAARNLADREAVRPTAGRRRTRDFTSLPPETARKLVGRWHALAILDLTALGDFRPEAGWISEKLGIEPSRAAADLKTLIASGLLKQENGRWKKDPLKLAIATPDGSRREMRRFHREMIRKALRALDSADPGDFAARDVTGALIPADPRLLPEARRRISRFRRNLITFLSSGNPSELYQLNVQLFSLSRAGRRR